MKIKKAFLNWSSGKDAMLALHRMADDDEVSVGKLITTINAAKQRVSMHGVADTLLKRQAASLDLPLEIINLKENITLSDYNAVMTSCLENLKAEGFTHGVFGDILLEDLKNYRQQQYTSKGLKTLFPLWKENTAELMREFIDLGYKAVVVCINSKRLKASFCGRVIDHQFLKDLPDWVDPCGENGEFHTFVYDGPLFTGPVRFTKGEQVVRTYQSSSQSDDQGNDDCFGDTESWDTEFLFQELVPSD